MEPTNAPTLDDLIDATKVRLQSALAGFGEPGECRLLADTLNALYSTRAAYEGPASRR